MSDFVNSFWSIYVAAVSVVSILACALLLWRQSSHAHTPGKTTGHVWDENLEEYSNPLPNWWRWLFYLTVIFSLLYLAIYPGLGAYPGALNWSSSGQFDAEQKLADTTYGPIFEKYKNQDIKAVAANSEAREMGQRLYMTYCAQCHGSDARGAKGFPNLTDKDWLWGGTSEKIKETLTIGRDAMMPAKGVKPDLTETEIGDVANYVRSLSNLAVDAKRAESGKGLFMVACAACHGPEAKGVPGLAPNLADNIWLFGNTEADIVRIITKGQVNRMPAFGEFLGEAKVHLLTAYVVSLGGSEPDAPGAAVAPIAAETNSVSPVPTEVAAKPAAAK
jgi:cytochrome c oxidase cbb3-type subunit III